MTHNTGDHPHIEVPQLIPEIAASPDHLCPTKQVRTPHLSPHPPLVVKPQDKKHRRVTIDNPQTDYYSSDDISSDSEDDLNKKSPLSVMYPMNGEGHQCRNQSLWHK